MKISLQPLICYTVLYRNYLYTVYVSIFLLYYKSNKYINPLIINTIFASYMCL